jgi:hypothetical protein
LAVKHLLESSRRLSCDPITIARQIAEGSKGNVRAALADFEMWIGVRGVEREVAWPEAGK